jgi:hypothetical protein
MWRNHFIPFAIGVIIAYCIVTLWSCNSEPVQCMTDMECENGHP